MTRRLALEFIGHSTILVELDGIRILTDPVTRARVGPLRRVEPVPHRDRLRGIDLVLLSHLHWDHLDVPSLRDLGRHLPLVVSAGAGAWLRAAGFSDVREVVVGDSIDVGSVRVRVVPAVHSGYRPPLGPTAPALGFVIDGSRSVYFAGDTDLFAGMGALGGPVDLALLPVWGWGPTIGEGHMNPERAAEAAAMLRPRLAVPIHWGTFYPAGLRRVVPAPFETPGLEFEAAAARLAPGVPVRVLAPGESVAIPAR